MYGILLPVDVCSGRTKYHQVHTTAVLQGEQNTFIKVLLENQMKKDPNSQSFTLTCTKSRKYTMFKITQLLRWNQNTSFVSFFLNGFIRILLQN